jgi:8-oxo-dGTP pyrophosphatase MutT (NUDIX family)
MGMTSARFTCPVAVHLFLRRGDEVLLLRRYHTGYEDGNYSVIAGHLDGNERIAEAACREALEEAGIVIDPEDIRIVGVMHRLSNDERIDWFVETSRWSGELHNAEPEKCDGLSWYAIDTLPSNVIPYIRRGLENAANGIAFDEFGWP